MENSNPKYSIIIGYYNHLHYLDNLVQALSNQTFKDFEVIFCDDGSNDGSEEYFKTANFPFQWTYKRQRNRGMRLAKNINQGIRVAKGEYCVFIMGDSFPELNYLEKLNDYVHHDYVVCGVRHHIDNGRAVDVDWRLKKGRIPQAPMIIMANPFEVLTGNGLVVPTEALGGGWNEKIRGYGGDDTELVARLYYQGYLCWSIPDLILYHHWHKATADNPKNRTLIDKFINKYSRYEKISSK